MTVATPSTSPGPGSPLDALASLFTPRSLSLELGVLLKFLNLGLMGCTQAISGPFDEGEQLSRRRLSSLSGTLSLSSPAGENSGIGRLPDYPHP